MADGAVEPGEALALSVGHADVGETATSLSIYADLGEVEAVWRAFEISAERTAFQAFDWVSTWQRHIGAPAGVTPAIVVGRDANSGAVRFILPLAVQRRHGLRRLMFLASDLCDYNAPLLAPSFAATLTPDAFQRLWAMVRRRLRADPRFRFDLCDLQKMPERIGHHANPFRVLRANPNPDRAYTATLGDDWEAFYAEKRSASTRKTERKQAKRLAEQGAVALATPDDEMDRAATIDGLIGQKRRALARMGADDIFDLPGRVAFYRAVASSPKLANLVHVARLEVGGEIGAASVALMHGETYSLVLSSYHDGALGQFGPGRAHLHALMRRAIDHKVRVFDFTIGDEPYKRDWCDQEVTLYDHLAAASLRALPLTAAVVVARGIKRRVKQTPALRHAATRIRAFGTGLADRARAVRGR